MNKKLVKHLRDVIDLDPETTRPQRKCPRCGVAPGRCHKAGCTVEQCSDCGGQRLLCGCKPAARLPWNGMYPGVLEAVELSWYAKAVTGGWEPCSAADPDALPDLNRVRGGQETRWDRRLKRFVLRKNHAQRQRAAVTS